MACRTEQKVVKQLSGRTARRKLEGGGELRLVEYLRASTPFYRARVSAKRLKSKLKLGVRLLRV